MLYSLTLTLFFWAMSRQSWVLLRHMQEVRKCELDGITEHIRVLDIVCELVMWTNACVEWVHECSAASHLCLHDRLDLCSECLGAEHLLEHHLEHDALMAQ